MVTRKGQKVNSQVNDDTHAVYEGIANDEFLYNEMEHEARYAAAVSDTAGEFHDELTDAVKRIVTQYREYIPGYSNSEDIDYSLIDYYEIAAEYDYDDYK